VNYSVPLSTIIAIGLELPGKLPRQVALHLRTTAGVLAITRPLGTASDRVPRTPPTHNSHRSNFRPSLVLYGSDLQCAYPNPRCNRKKFIDGALEDHLKCKLKLSWGIRYIGNCAEVWGVQHAIRIRKYDGIGAIEGISSEL
jgi:hypothetical protein